MAKEVKDLVVGLDIGTAKVMAVVAEVMPDGELRPTTIFYRDLGSKDPRTA